MAGPPLVAGETDCSSGAASNRVAGVAVWVLFNRSGNASIIRYRPGSLRPAVLEAALCPAADKKFLVGHPALMLAAAGWAEDNLPAAAVGSSSSGAGFADNTFVHLHTPVAFPGTIAVGIGGGALVGPLLLGSVICSKESVMPKVVLSLLWLWQCR